MPGVFQSFAASGTQTTMGSADLDNEGNRVPTYKPHSYTYDGSGNMATDTVSDGTSTWVRSYAWTNAALMSDTGWVKQ